MVVGDLGFGDHLLCSSALIGLLFCMLHFSYASFTNSLCFTFPLGESRVCGLDFANKA